MAAGGNCPVKYSSGKEKQDLDFSPGSAAAPSHTSLDASSRKGGGGFHPCSLELLFHFCRCRSWCWTHSRPNVHQGKQNSSPKLEELCLQGLE